MVSNQGALNRFVSLLQQKRVSEEVVQRCTTITEGLERDQIEIDATSAIALIALGVEILSEVAPREEIIGLCAALIDAPVSPAPQADTRGT